MSEKTIVLTEDNSFISRVKFVFYIFTPIILSFVIPPLFYQWPIKFRTGVQITDLETGDILYALLICIIWFGLAIGVIFWPVRNNKNYCKTRNWTPSTLRNVFIIFSTLGGIVALFNYFYIMPPTLETLVHLISFMPTVAFVLGQYVIRDNNGLSKYHLNKTVLMILLLSDLSIIIFPIILGFVAPVIFSSVAILYGIHVIRLSLFRKFIIGGVFIGIIIAALPFKHYLRETLYNGMFQRIPIVSILKREKKSVPQIKIQHKQELRDEQKEFSIYDPNYHRLRFFKTQGNLDIVHYGINRILNRINHFGELAYVIKMHPKEIPYTKMETYYPLLSKLIPRVLWSNKPKENMGQFFGHKYDFLNTTDMTTSIVLPIVVEGWMSYGWFGVIFSAFFMGIMLRMIWLYWIGTSDAPGNTMIGIVVVMTAVVQESNLSFVMGEVVFSAIFYLIIEELIRYRQNFAPGRMVVISTEKK